jgi:hypothetical protein
VGVKFEQVQHAHLQLLQVGAPGEPRGQGLRTPLLETRSQLEPRSQVTRQPSLGLSLFRSTSLEHMPLGTSLYHAAVCTMFIIWQDVQCALWQDVPFTMWLDVPCVMWQDVPCIMWQDVPCVVWEDVTCPCDTPVPCGRMPQVSIGLRC